MTTPDSTTLLLKDISPHRRRIKILLFIITFIQLLVLLLFPTIFPAQHILILIIVLVVSLIYQLLYWTVFLSRLKSRWRMAIVAIPIFALSAASAYYSNGLLSAAAFVLFVTTIIAYESAQLTLVTSTQVLTLNMLFLIDRHLGILTNEAILATSILNICMLAVGGLAIITSFEIKEKEQRMVHLETMDHIKNSFLSIISHHLRTPATILKGSFELQKSQNKEKNPLLTKEIEEAFQRLDNTIENIIQISSLQSGDIVLSKQNISSTNIIEQALDPNLIEEARRKGLKIIKSLSVHPLTADPKLLTKAIKNILENAIRNTTKGQITITTEKENANFTLKIEDTGPGIPQEFLKTIASQFSRLQDPLSYDNPGLGIGLYMTKTIIELHGGHITIESLENKGTKVKLILPII